MSMVDPLVKNQRPALRDQMYVCESWWRVMEVIDTLFVTLFK